MKSFFIELWDVIKIVCIIPLAIIIVQTILYAWDHLAEILGWIT